MSTEPTIADSIDSAATTVGSVWPIHSFVTASTELTLLHGVIAVVFVGVYVAIETGVHEGSGRLYVALLNLSQPISDTLLTSTEEYNEY